MHASIIRCTLLAALLGSLTAVATAAQPGTDPASRTVRYTDLDLSHGAGAAALYARIRAAAGAVCEPLNPRPLETVVPAHRCLEEAIRRAVSEVNAPALTRYYAVKAGHPITVARR